ncbi:MULTISPECIES: hypothetical protein [unclassified Arsukibacterium]|uniref:hypothetical protein n=1 Tax=unclassified Arsukibacterium TaxID=2635278 RepID=UPI000C592691|nr:MULTISPECIES: hypothetical protein [unclassified Arsukibacterium]MAA93926.1 hypothetical protein [Rheinheimera sp.]MBM35077.1 hypothetical protein [Rheinheimera sp.]
MDKETLANELNRVQERDKRHLKILIVGLSLLTIFGFFTVALLMDSLKSRYEAKFEDFEIKTENITSNMYTQLDVQKKAFNEMIELRDEILDKLNMDVRTVSQMSKEEIDELWLTAYVKSTNNRKDIIEMTDQVADMSSTIKELKISLAHFEQTMERVSALEIDAENGEKDLNGIEGKLQQLIDRITAFENKIEQNLVVQKAE